MSFLDTLDPKYTLILCDVWGVVHDGVSLYQGAEKKLKEWRAAGRCVCLITNAPRTADAVGKQLADLGLARDSYDFIATSGEAGIAALSELSSAIGFLGTLHDRAIIEDRGVRIAGDDRFADLACTGLADGRPDPEAYRQELEGWAEGGVRMHCLNPDRMVMRGGKIEACAGALADIYEEVGGEVLWYGKPYRPIYEHALFRSGRPPASRVLAIGDGLQTDMLGAASMGFDAVFVSGGIHRGEAIPEIFLGAQELGSWRPVAVVTSLGSGRGGGS